MTESSGALIPPVGRIMEEFAKPLSSLLKKSLRAILGESRTTDEELLTAMVEVEGVLEFPSLTYCSSDPNDEHVLTPNHFLYGQMGWQLAPEVIDDLAFNLRNRWRFTQDLISKCWKRLMKEYLSALEHLKQMGWGETQQFSRWCGPRGGSRQPTRALAFRSNSRGFSWSWRKGQSCTRQNGRQRLCATNHEVVSVGDINRREGIEHSHIRAGGCSRECSLIHTNAVRWDGRTEQRML